MNKELSTYLKSKHLSRLLKLLKDKFISIGRYSGVVSISNLTKEECIDIGDLLGKTLKIGSTLKVSYKELTRKINETRFQGFTWDGLFKCYFNEEILTKKEKRKLVISSYESMISELLSKYKLDIPGIKDSNSKIYRLLKSNYNKDNNLLYSDLDNIFNLLSNMPKSSINLSIYASTTGNPHYLDLNTRTSNLYLKLLCYINNEEYPTTNDKRIELLARYNIYVDSLSNYIITYNLCGNEILDIFYNNKQIFNMNLSNVLSMDRIDSKEKRVYIFENPSILNSLANTNYSIIITSGNPNITLYKVLDKLVLSGNKLYYNGDFDPEGLLIADNLKKRYKELELICYNKDDYINSISSETINKSRLNKLNKIESEELSIIKDLLVLNKKAGYQEKNIDNIKEFMYLRVD